jgi:acyl carrier protein
MTMTSTTNPTTNRLSDATLERIVRPFLRFLPAGDPLPPDASLGEAGLDSMASIDLIIQLEDELGISIPDDQLTENSLSTLAEIRKLVTGLQAAA